MSVLTKEQLDKAKTVLALGMSAELYANVTREDLLDTIADLQSQLARANETADAKAAAVIEEAKRVIQQWAHHLRCGGWKGENQNDFDPEFCDCSTGILAQNVAALTPADASRALAEQIRKAKLDMLNDAQEIVNQELGMWGGQERQVLDGRLDEIVRRFSELSRTP